MTLEVFDGFDDLDGIDWNELAGTNNNFVFPADHLQFDMSNTAVGTSYAYNGQGSGLRLFRARMGLGYEFSVSTDTVIVGCHFIYAEIEPTDRELLNFMNASSAAISGRIQRVYIVGNQLRLEYNGNDILLGNVVVGVGYHIEMKVVSKNDATGSIEIRLNGNGTIPIYEVAGVVTSDDVDSDIFRVFFGNGVNQSSSGDSSTNGERYIDNIVVMSGGGSDFNDFIGESRDIVLNADGVTATDDWTPNGEATTWESVAVNDNDLTYMESGVSGDRTVLTFEDLQIDPDIIFAVGIRAKVRKDDAGAAATQIGLDSNGTENQQNNFNPATGYIWTPMHTLLDNPDTVSPWSFAAVNAVLGTYENTTP